jgi:hypothetical protein
MNPRDSLVRSGSFAPASATDLKGKSEVQLGFLTKHFSGFSRNTKLAKMLMCFAKLLQEHIFTIFVFRESYNFRETREIRLIKHNGTCHGF